MLNKYVRLTLTIQQADALLYAAEIGDKRIRDGEAKS